MTLHVPGRRLLLEGSGYAHSLLRDLVGFWPLDEAAGAAALDLSGNGLTLSDNATVGAGVGPSYRLPRARDFEKDSVQYLSRADEALLSWGDEAQTIIVWVNPESLVITSSIVVKGDLSTAATAEYGLFWLSITNRYRYTVSNGTTQTAISADTFGDVSAGAWSMVCGQHDPVANLIKISVNGGPFDTAAHTLGIQDGTAAFEIGRDTDTFIWDGLITAVPLWRRVLSDAEVRYMYNGRKGRRYVAGRGFI